MNQPNREEMEDFKQILNEEIAIYEAMEKQLAQKKEIVIRGDIPALINLDTELEKLTARIQELEKRRLALMVDLGREGETLKTFIESLESGEDARMLDATRAKMVDTTTEIKKLSAVNRDLLSQSIRFIEQSVEFIAAILSPEGAAYTSRPGPNPTTGRPAESNFCPPSTISREA